VNTNLQDMAQKYAIRLSEEKEEKKSLQEKYDFLEKEFFNKVTDYSVLQVQGARKFYIACFVGVFIFTVLLFTLLLFYKKLYIF
jgi:hypothetical protein